VAERGEDYKVLQKTTVEHGTNRVHKYTELATGLNYKNSYGQWIESQEQITIQPNGARRQLKDGTRFTFRQTSTAVFWKLLRQMDGI